MNELQLQDRIDTLTEERNTYERLVNHMNEELASLFEAHQRARKQRRRAEAGKITDQEQAAIGSLRARGFSVVIWTPEEIGTASINELEDIIISRGSDYLGFWADEKEYDDAE